MGFIRSFRFIWLRLTNFPPPFPKFVPQSPMNRYLPQSELISGQHLNVSGSKSETNRLLLLQALFPEITLTNISNSDDSDAMTAALKSTNELVDVQHAGTAMRFLTAYFASAEGREVLLTGSQRMKERPIGILVDALRQLGADIAFVEKEGFPPLRIRGKKLTHNKVALKADVSSQFISALLLIAPRLENGLELSLKGNITSAPYINMTLALLDEIGIVTKFAGNTIRVAARSQPAEARDHNKAAIHFTVESDWSSSSYYYSLIALSPMGSNVTLASYKKDSLQGDSALADIYTAFGVQTHFDSGTIRLQKTDLPTQSPLHFQLNETPDIAQTIAVTCFGLGMGCHLTGLATLKIKETDRLQALRDELSRLGAMVFITDDTLRLEPSLHINPDVSIQTYNDHRMAMAFAPLALKTSLLIEDAQVVSKSYPGFWEDLKKLGLFSEAK